MAGKSLRSYLDRIRDDAAEFRTVTRPVDPNKFEITALLEHLHRRREFPAVLFANPLNMYGERSQFPVLSNLWATRERCADAVGLPRSEAGAMLGRRFAEKISERRKPEIVASGSAPSQAYVLERDKADQWILPVVRHAEMDLGRVMTMALAAHPPGEDAYNVTFVKAFPESPRRAGLTIHSKDMGRITKAWERRGERFPIINILGHHPAFWLGSLNNTPYGDNEYETIGAYMGEPVRLVPSVTWGREFLVPADAEIVIEGEVIPGERTIVDPFGEISMQYQPQQFAPVMEVTAITYGEEAIFQDIFSGHPEHMLLGSIPREGAVYNHLQQKLGFVHEVHAPLSGCGRFTLYISIHRTSEGQAKQAGLQAIAHVPGVQTAVVVDDDIDVMNEQDVVWAVNTYVDPNRDVDLIKNVLEPSDPRGLGSARLIIDATRPTHVPFPTRLRVPDEAMERVQVADWLDPVGGVGK